MTDWKDKATDYQAEKKRVSDNIKGELEIHIKYGGDWFVAMGKKDVVMSNLPHAIDLVSINICTAMKKIIYDFDHQDFQKLHDDDYIETKDDDDNMIIMKGVKKSKGGIRIDTDDML
jgi:proline racemase